MKVLAIYPGLNPTFDEVAYVLPPLVAKGVAVGCYDCHNGPNGGD